MQKTVLWTGIEYESLEHCQLTIDQNGVHIDSVIIGSYQGQSYRVVYTLSLNADWEFKLCAIKAVIGEKTTAIVLEKKTDGWWLDAEFRADFENCTDIDIPLTPLTNSLPVNRLKLKSSEEQEIEVVYIDLLSDSITPKKQNYRCVDPQHYHYENIPNDFEAEITVDENGLVVDYPLLFARKNNA